MVRKTVHRLATLSVLVMASITASVPSADAVVSTSGCGAANACTLAELLTPGAFMVVNDKAFANWTLDASQGLAEGALGNILVAGLDTDPLNPGLAYLGNGQLDVTGNTALQLGFHFDVAVVNGSNLRIKDHALALVQGTATGTGVAAVDSGILDLLLNPLTAQHVDLTSPVANGTFAQQAIVRVNEQINVASSDLESGASLALYAEFFSQEPVSGVPEPAILALVGIGFAGIEVLRRRWITK
jgi:hypothetical protein